MRIVYSVRCSWWDSIAKVGTRDGTPGGLPCCPFCGSPLFEMADEDEWWTAIAEAAVERGSDYPAFIAWGRGRCYPTLDRAYTAFREELARRAG